MATKEFDLGLVVGPQGPRGEAGPVGPQGPRGEQGIQGIQGPKGDKGDKGEVGPQGPQGPQGLKGDAGPKGDRGLKGEQGPQGDTGATGLQGPKGDKGDKGDTGPQGPRGLQGEPGPVGPVGPKGDQGLQGQTGPEGPKGDKGDPGITPAIATQTEAENGTDDTKMMTPLKTWQAIKKYIATFLMTAVFTGIIKGVTPPSNANDKTIPTTEWVQALLASRVMSLVVQDYLLEQNGYVRFRFGLILQWGTISAGDDVWQYPIAFRIKCHCALGGARNATDTGYTCSIQPTLTSLKYNSQKPTWLMVLGQ